MKQLTFAELCDNHMRYGADAMNLESGTAKISTKAARAISAAAAAAARPSSVRCLGEGV